MTDGSESHPYLTQVASYELWLKGGLVEGVGEQEEHEFELKASEGHRMDVAAEVGEDAAEGCLDGVADDLLACFDLGPLAAHASHDAGRLACPRPRTAVPGLLSSSLT